MTNFDESKNDDDSQLTLFSKAESIVHYFDKDGGLHSGRLVRRVKKGRKKGAWVVRTAEGREIIPFRIRNIE